jgi:putative hydroxymethylpyrimidine transport system permease protein
MGLIGAWYAVAHLFALPDYLLPDPVQVIAALWTQRSRLLANAGVTVLEIVVGLSAGTALGAITALAMMFSRHVRRWLMPILIVSQAIPVFAIAPLLVLWFGFGMASKEVMAVMIIYFPVTTAFFDGLLRTEPGWLDLAKTMNASPLRVLVGVRLPAALPAFASGLRVATAVAPIGAIVGEWVGSSAGLGFVMLNANAQLQTNVMFAALLILATIAVAMWFAVDIGLRRLLYWMPEAARDPVMRPAPI